MTAEKIEGNIQILIGIVCLPPECRNGGLFAWSVMGHEVAGHNFIQSKPGLLDELTSKVTDAIEKRLTAKLKVEDVGYVKILSEYWSKKQRVEELSSDLLGILSTGPSLAIGCIGYFRGMSQNGFLKTRGPFEAQKKRDVLDIQGEVVNIRLKEISKKVNFEESHGILGNAEDGAVFQYRVYKIPSGPHPIQALRPFAMVEAIKQTNLDKKLQEIWAQLITNEVLSKEFSKEQFVKIIKINPDSLLEEDNCILFQVACISAEIVANIITTTKLEILGKKKITEVFNWKTKDEKLVESVRVCYQKNLKSLDRFVSTNHIVAAAIMEASILNSNIKGIFQTMKQHLIQIQGKV